MRAERHTLTSAEWTSCSACHELLCSRAFLFIVLRSAQHPQIPRFLQNFRGIWPMPLSLLNHSALALFAQRTRIPTSARSIGFCAIWGCISSSSSSSTSRVMMGVTGRPLMQKVPPVVPKLKGANQDRGTSWKSSRLKAVPRGGALGYRRRLFELPLRELESCGTCCA